MNGWYCILCILSIGCVWAEPSASARLTGVRCQYPSPHDGSKHRMILRVDVQPDTPGWVVYESSARAMRLKGRDSAGNSLISEPSDWEALPGQPGGRRAYFSFMLQGRVDRMEVQETLQIKLAEHLRSHSLRSVSMVEETQHESAGITLRCKPESSNSAAENREADGTLSRAGMSIIFPDDVNILRVSRVWRGVSDELPVEEMPEYSQDLEFKLYTTPSGEKYAYIVLWGAAAEEDLQITTCRSQCTVQAPLRFRAMLGEPRALPAAQEIAADKP